MPFLVEIVPLAGRRVLVVFGIVTTVVSLGALVLSRDVLVAACFLLGFLTVAGFLAAHGFWRECDEARGELRSIENTPAFKIDAVLKGALELRESLRHNLDDLDEKQARVRTGALVAECVTVVNECAPAYVDDLNTKRLDNAGEMLHVVGENYRVLADIRKKLGGSDG